MKLTNAQIANYVNSLNRCMKDEEFQNAISNKVKFAMARNLRKLSDEGKEFLQKNAELHKEYGVLQEDGVTSKISDENMPKYQQEIKEIENIEIDVDIMKVPAEEFYNSKLSAMQMMALVWMADEEGEEK